MIGFPQSLSKPIKRHRWFPELHRNFQMASAKDLLGGDQDLLAEFGSEQNRNNKNTWRSNVLTRPC
jgi:hypothetical protein